jgi:tRNA-Thr(GGU) m(6)t(6)A37 methyltransferase TsaA
MTRTFCRNLTIIGCSCSFLLFFSGPVIALKSGGISPYLSPSSSLLFSRRRKLLKPQPTKGVFAATKISTSSTLSPTSLSAEKGKFLVENMIANNNFVGAAAAVTTIAVITSMLSRRRTLQLQNELGLLKEEKRKIETKNQEEANNVCDYNRKKINEDRNAEKPTDKRGKAQNRKHHQQTEEEDLAVMRIGVIRSIYRLCVGTPRQGLLAPDARGRIELDKIGNSSIEATVSGLEDFSYIWILFHFHLNTQSAKKERRFKSKIAPPALGGKKVGIYATRSPHRHNPIGITLCKLDRIQVHGPHKVTLHVSGLDLVDGTPVLDIKPYVPVYDSVNIFSRIENPNPSSDMAAETITSPQQPSSTALQLPPPRVPGWVEGGLATKRNVVVTEKAKNELEEILQHDAKALEFYGSHCFADLNDDADNTMETMLRVIEQVLSIDVRSSHQTRKARTGRSQAERAKRIRTRFDVEPALNSSNESEKPKAITTEELPENKMCTQQLDNLLIYFSVKEIKGERESSEGSG